MPLMKGIKQSDDKSCVACVAAMATRTTVDDFVKFVSPKEAPYSEIDLLRYLIAHNYYMGIGVSKIEKLGREIIWCVYGVISGNPAYVAVNSERFEGKGHAIYWDGKQIWDPNPETEDGRRPDSYDITGWWPITDIREI